MRSIRWATWCAASATPCPGPYSKVKVIVELTGPRENADPSGNIHLYYSDYGANKAGTIWAGSTQITDDIAVVRVERTSPA